MSELPGPMAMADSIETSNGNSADAETRPSQADESNATEDQDDEIRRLRIQVFQLKNIIRKLTKQDRGLEEDSSSVADEAAEAYCRANKRGKTKTKRQFDFTLYKKRHVLLMVSYLGWDYHGFAVQETSGRTIESELFRALAITRLIESRDTANYHRCGRTDKGVSAFRQVISIDLRSNLLEGEGVFDYEGCRAHLRKRAEADDKDSQEIAYCQLLNAVLPDEIQVLAWSPCSSAAFSARFDCTSRTYKYFFPAGDLDLDRMTDAGRRLVGQHDFRNFCKMDVNNGVVNYTRRIDDVRFDRCLNHQKDRADPYSICCMTIKGKAFLWHQIRCIVAVLFRVGQGHEDPRVVDKLLDVEGNPCRPQYTMASELPLNLFDVEYDGANLSWNYDGSAVAASAKQLQSLWTQSAVKAAMVRAMLGELEAAAPEVADVRAQSVSLVPVNKAKNYVPLMEMLKCPSLDEKVAKASGRKRKRPAKDNESA